MLDEHAQLTEWDARDLDELMKAFDAAESSCHLPEPVVATVRSALDRWSREARNGATDRMPALTDLSEWTEEMAPPDPGEDTSEIEAHRAGSGAPPPGPEPVAVTAPVAAPSPPAFVEPGTMLLGRYEILRRLGRGGTAFVHLARDLRRDAEDGDAEYVAIKSPRPEGGDPGRAVARLKREFRQTRALSHPHIVRMHDLDRQGDLWFITMEWIDGESLVERMQRSGPLRPADALSVARACAQALAFAHGRGIVHGDFKPSNVMIRASGEVRLLDFGAAPDSTSVDDVESGEDMRRMMTRCYASPETLDGEVPTPRDDVFSLACVIYELVSGAHPFQRRSSSEARAVGATAMPLESLSPAQNEALARGLAWERDNRPFGALELLDSLEATDCVATPAPAVAAAAPSREAAVSAAAPESIVVPAPDARVASPASAGVAPGIAEAVPGQRTAAPPHAPPLVPFPRFSVGLAAAAAIGVILFLPHREPAPAATPSSKPPEAVVPVAPTAVPAPAPLKSKSTSGKTAASGTAPAERAERNKGATPRAPSARVGFDAAGLQVDESAFAAVLTLRRSGDLRTRVPIQWRINGGSAEAGRDFGGASTGTARFAAGQTLRTLYVPLIDDHEREPSETFSVTLNTRGDAAEVGPLGRATVTIADDD